jgi:hypothetical protein
MITPGKPDVTLHRGSGKEGPVVGVVKLRLSTDFKVGLGDFNVDGGSNVVWEDVKCERKWKKSEYNWTTSSPSSRDRRTFRWQRVGWRNWKLVDEDTADVVATYQRNGLKSWKKRGILTINGDIEEQFEIMALLVMLGIIEKARRRNS